MNNYLSFDTKIRPKNHSIAKIKAFFVHKLNDGAVTESTQSFIGLPWQYSIEKNGGQDRYSYFYNIFGSGASTIAYYCLSYTNLLYMIYSSDK